MAGENNRYNEYASPACFMHEIDAAYSGLAPATDAQQRLDLERWRHAERERLIGARLAIDAETRRKSSGLIMEGLKSVTGDISGRTVSAYWPFRGEPDLRGFLDAVWSFGGRAALPIVIEKHRPLVFRTWKSGEELMRGVWNIPIPAGGEEVTPDIVIAPVVGYDKGCYRLGYGGGFFDRTLAAMPVKPLILGVGYAQSAIPTIYPQAHDIAMDRIVTEQGIFDPAR